VIITIWQLAFKLAGFILRHLISIIVRLTNIIGLKSLVMPSLPFEKPLAFYGMAELFQSETANDDETVSSFFQRRFGHEVRMILLFLNFKT